MPTYLTHTNTSLIFIANILENVTSLKVKPNPCFEK